MLGQNYYDLQRRYIPAAGYNVRNYGAVGDGATDDTDAINSAIDALRSRGGAGIYFPYGTYMISDTIDLTDLSHVVIEGTGSIIQTAAGANFTNKSMVDLAGTGFSQIYGIHILSDLATNLPVCGLDVGRTGSSPGGTCSFINCMFEGKYTVASVYDICSELNCWITCFFQSATTLPAYYTSSMDTAGLGLTESSNVSKTFINCTLVNYSGSANSCAIRCQYAVQEIEFHHCYFVIPEQSTVIDSIGHATYGVMQGLFIYGGRTEGDTSATSVFLKHSTTDLNYVYILLHTYLIVSDYVILIQTNTYHCIFDFSVNTYATKYIDVTNSAYFTFNEVKGSIDGGIYIDAGAFGGYNLLYWLGGYPYSGAGSYDFDYSTDGQSDIMSVLDTSVHHVSMASRTEKIAPLGDGDTTPSVMNHDFYYVYNTNATSITNFDDPMDGQEIEILFTNGNTTILNNANIQLGGSANWNPALGSMLRLKYVHIYSKWVEISRMAP